jgi:hypothetical protein
MGRCLLGLLGAGVLALACAPDEGSSEPGRDVPIDRHAEADGGEDLPDGTVPDTTTTDDAAPTDHGPPLPPDSDNDGLSDEDELARHTDPTNEDTDGDGIGDGVEVLAGTDPLDPGSTIPPTDYYVVLPYLDPPDWRDLDFTARLGKGDIFFLVDTTGSMATAINNVRSSLAGVIVPGVNAAIAAPFGDVGDWTFQLRQRITNDTAAVQTALNGLRVGGGNDGPEAQLEGLFQTVDGGDCGAGGGFGAACFREDSHPIIVVVTDAPAHNDGVAANAYDSTVSAHTWSETMAALNAHNVKILGAAVKVMAIIPSEAQADLTQAARDTSSFNRAGDPTVYPAVGGAVSDVVVGGIVDLVAAERQDVGARSIDDPSDAVDATLFIKEIRPVWASDATRFDDVAFYGVSGGTTVRFSIHFENDFRPAEEHVQIYRAQIEVHDLATMTPLDVRNVYIVVPGEGGFLI